MFALSSHKIRFCKTTTTVWRARAAVIVWQRFNITVLLILDLAASYRKAGKYDEAYQLYHTICGQMEGCLKIRPSINKAMCLLETDQLRQARREVRFIVKIVDSSLADVNMPEVYQLVESQLRELAERFIESHEVTAALTLARCRFHIIQAIPQEDLARLLGLEKIGLLLQNVAEEMASIPKRPRSKSTYQFMCNVMEDILEEMQKVPNVDIRIKSSRIAWFLKYIGFCSDEMEDYQRSLLVYSQAIMLMKTVYGAEARLHKVLGFCYNNLAYVYEHTNQMKDSLKALKSAADIFNDAVDWSSDEDKSKCVAKTVAALHSLKDKITNSGRPSS